MLYDLGEQHTDKTLSRASVPLKTRWIPCCWTQFVQQGAGVGFPLLMNARAEAADTEQELILLITETTQSCHKDLTPAACVTPLDRIPEISACTLAVKANKF